MQNYNSKSLQIELLLVELNCCINDLYGFHQHLDIGDINHAELQLLKLDALISNIRKRPDHLNLTVG